MTDSLRSIHVVAAVIADVRGRLLLSRRTENSDMPGLWEFPGGKRESGETSEQALARELYEELGISADVGEWLMEVPQLYPGKRLRLEVRRVRAWKGGLRGREGQALTWVEPDKLLRYSMPPADQPVVGMLRQPDRYLVTPEPGEQDAEWLDAVEHAYRLGIERIQLRMRRHDPVRWSGLVRQAVQRRGRAHVEVLLNRDIALAEALGIGVHLGAEQLAVLDARPLPVGLPVGASCHCLADLCHAQRIGCDFAVLGPVLPTESHPGAVTLGWEGFEQLREQVALPIYAIGGMCADQVKEARRHGAQGIAAMRGLWPGGAKQ